MMGYLLLHFSWPHLPGQVVVTKKGEKESYILPWAPLRKCSMKMWINEQNNVLQTITVVNPTKALKVENRLQLFGNVSRAKNIQ